ncbi:DUF2147 domain-containing protein [Olivibacter domesticus]|uniref:Uncharacterized conserved protein, DUF2147 family n=1 Tax=Olivibacter domesticus TaxID=407022 RepID=A0A1H7GXV0_OLID1|nr:DUF2147 domain-containing protein [Olivibacter domesticus]SEK42911.1 Uncharacterized conserved protein, DUF2147 family [Olivibacter domesticus]
MKKLLFATMMFFITFVSSAQNLSADQITGIWLSEDSDVKLKFEFYKSGNEYFGKLLWASTMFEADGKTPKKDPKNPDKQLRNRSRQHIVNVTHLRYVDGEYVDGKLYNPDDGRTYSVKATLKTANQLEFRGYVGISLLGRTMQLKRIQ